MKGWTYSSKKQEAPPEPTNTEDNFLLEKTKRKAKKEALEWDDFVL